jgi:opacity protein-like surface antigen
MLRDFFPGTSAIQPPDRNTPMPRKIIVSCISVLALTAPAFAADLAPPPIPVSVFTWTGPYIGAQIGYAWGDNFGNFAFVTPGGIIGASALGGIAQGVIGGGHAGYNLQISQWVIGLEGSVDGATVTRNVISGFPDPTDPTGTRAASVTSSVRSTVQGSIRGRAGFAWDRLLIYGTGGVAFGGFTSNLQLSGIDVIGPFFASGSRSSTRVGWTAGGGVQYTINNNWSIMAEYRYSDFGHIQDVPVTTVAGLSLAGDRHLVQNQVQVGFSYKFDVFAPSPVVAKY